MSNDFGKLRSIINLLTPGLYAMPLMAGRLPGPSTKPCLMRSSSSSPAIHSAIARPRRSLNCLARKTRLVLPPRIAPRTRGHDREVFVHLGLHLNPKAVINTHRMPCANQAMLGSSFAFVEDQPPVVVGTGCPGATPSAAITISGWAMYGESRLIDDGNPTPPGVTERQETCARLHRRSISMCPELTRR